MSYVDIRDDAPLWSFSKTGKKLGKHRTTIRRWANNGNLRVMQVRGGVEMVVAQSVYDLVQGQLIEPKS
jgi:hypothetical protein